MEQVKGVQHSSTRISNNNMKSKPNQWQILKHTEVFVFVVDAVCGGSVNARYGACVKSVREKYRSTSGGLG